MGINSFFLDTYALYEIISGNRHYTPYLAHTSLVTTRLNLMELYYALLRTHDAATAKHYYLSFLPYCIDFPNEVIWDAMHVKYARRQKRLSYIDCVGYLLALSLHIPFLTGDRQFEGLPSVEFVK